MEEHPIRLSGKLPGGTFVGRHVAVFLDDRAVDVDALAAADEIEGRLDFLCRTEERHGIFRYEIDPATKQPRILSRRGKVEIRLKDDAPIDVRAAYEALRAGRPEEAERIRLGYYQRLEEDP